MLKLGDKVKLSQEGIFELSKQSKEHIDEYRNSIGVIISVDEYNWDDIDYQVRWSDGLKYIYPDWCLYDYTVRMKKFKRLLKE